MVKPVALFVGVLLGCVQAVFTIGHAAPQPVTAISAHYETTTGTSGDYTDPAGNVIQFNQGQDNLLLIDSMTVNGHRLVSDRKADVVRVRRITANTCVDSPGCNTNIGNISGEKLFFQYPYLGSPLEHNLKPPRAHSLEELYRLNALNISADNPLGNLDNNIERIDIMFSEGVRVPETVGGRQLTGFMIAERWGNNPHQIAAIAAVDNQGDPAAFYPLSKGNVNDYGDTQFTITHADGSVTGPANYTPSSHRYRNQDAPVPGGVAGSETNPLNGLPEYFLSTSQPVRAAFHSFEQLGVPAGATVYGFSAFGVDVTQAMDLVGLTDVPLNTDRIIQDSADIFGAVGAVFVPGSQAPIGIAKAVTDQQELEAGVWDVELTLVVENLSSDTPAPNIQVTDDLSATFAGAASFEVMGNPGTGGLTPATPAYDGRDQIQLLAGTDTLAPGDQETIRFRVRVDIGMSDGIYLNSARVTSALAVGEPPASSDWSDEGSDPDPDGDGFANGPGEDDPTAILLGAETGLIAVDKVAGKSQVSIGDLVPYTLTVRNNAGREISEAAVRDTPPPGFSYVEDSAVLVRRGGDGRFGTSDDSSEPLFPEGDRTLVFGPFSLAPGEIVSINYLLRVGAGVVPGEARNVAVPYVAEDPVGPSDAAALEVVRDVTFEQGAIIGVVFHDRDADGYQDAVAATRLRLKVHGIDEFVDTRGVRFLAHEDQLVGGNYAQGFWISHIDGRAYASRSSALRQVQVIIPLKPQTTEGDLFNGLVTLESGEGTWLEGSLLGSNRLEDKRGDVARGVNNQRLAFYGRVQTGERGRFVVLTVVNDAIDEAGIPGVRLATTQGVLIETDAYGRYHLADPMLIEKSRGGNFILKVDPHTLPKDATFTTENPRVMRITGSILNRFNFGVSVPEAEVPTTDAVKRLPAYTRMERQKHIDFNTRFIDEEIGAIQFGSGQSALDAADRAQLAPAIAKLTGKSSVEVHATGHADPVPL
ncbi:MAG TPA: hypothetical protein DD979_09880, partial [Gammaproteobacteria bacterium]|nr:hypothetical protein [Gammaproteobacteria bacterium]